MFSPQRVKSPFDRFSPSPQRSHTEAYGGLSLEDYLNMKSNKSSPIRKTPQSSPKRASPFRSSPNRSSPHRSSPVQSPMRVTKLSPGRHSPLLKNARDIRSSPLRKESRPRLQANRTPPSTKLNSPIQKSNIKPKKTLEEQIKVCVRKRPLNATEVAHREKDIVSLSSPQTLQVKIQKEKVDLTSFTRQQTFTFDHVFDSDTTNDQIYANTARPLVDHIFQGGNATCFTYGQTGTGKTYTMFDLKSGLFIKAIKDIFNILQQGYTHLQVWVQYYEIYQGQLYDLLNKRNQLVAREDGKGNIQIVGLKEHQVTCTDTMLHVFKYGNQARSTSKTDANEASSRSHAVFQIMLKSRTTGISHGKFGFVDLAGSERGVDRGQSVNPKIRQEGAEINRSLLALKECIRALDNRTSKHTPFRSSKLTMVLKESFLGNSKTCMIATISPNHSNCDHTVNTLKYADRIKELQMDQTEIQVQHKISQGYIKEFLQWHQVQIKCNQRYVMESSVLLEKLVKHFECGYSVSLDQNYQIYKQRLQDLLDKKQRLIEASRHRIEQELED